MTLRAFFRDNDGDVVEIENPWRIRVQTTEATTNGEEGSVGTWEVEIDDPDGTFNVRGFRIFYMQEDAAVADDQHGIIGVWYTGDRNVSRMSQDGGEARTGRGRTWRLSLHDINTRLSWRINVGNDCERPAETDLERIAWLMTTNEMNVWLEDDDTYIDSTDGVDMDEVDYTGQTLMDVIDDCAQQSGREYGLLWKYSGNPSDPVDIFLWYKFAASTDYSSAKKINNVLGEVDQIAAVAVDGQTVYGSSMDAELNRSPSRVAWGVYQAFDGGAVYQTNAVTAERFNKIDVVGRGENVKTAAQAAARANRYLNSVSDEETDRIDVSVIVTPADVNSILPFHRIQVHFEHLPGYQGEADDDYFWMRVKNRTVRDISPDFYEIAMTLQAGALDEFPTDEGGGGGGEDIQNWRAVLVNVSGPYPLPTGALLWGKNGDQVAPWTATIGPFDFVATSGTQPPGWAAILVTDDIVITSMEMQASAIGVSLGVNEPYTVRWEITHNGAAVATFEVEDFAEGASSSWNGNPTLTALNIVCAAGDVIAGTLSCTGVDGGQMEMFRSPHGIEPGYLIIHKGYYQ